MCLCKTRFWNKFSIPLKDTLTLLRDSGLTIAVVEVVDSEIVSAIKNDN